MKSLKSFVPQDVCLSCQGCCRYAERSTVWAPVFLFEEIVSLTSENLLPCSLFSHAGGRRGEASRINLLTDKDGCLCPCLDKGTNKCKIYAHRPFDCQFYPFLLTRKKGQVFLAVDLKCPYAQKELTTAAFKDHVKYLAEFFSSQETVAWMAKNTAIIQEYPESELEILSPLPQLDFYGPSAARPQR